jgi:hypothetical protein
MGLCREVLEDLDHAVDLALDPTTQLAIKA